jgi:hypothetical protein
VSELRYRFNIDGIDKTSSLLGGLSQTIDNVVGKLGKANAEMVTVAGQTRRLVITGAGPSSSDAQPRIDPSTIEPATKGMYETAKTFAGPATAEKLKKNLEGIQENILEGLFPASVLKNLTFGINPLLNPTSVWGNLFALRQNFSALASKDGRPLQEKILGGVGLGRLSGTTGGAAAATGVLMAGLLAVGLSLKALTVVITKTSEAFSKAAQLYSKALTSGMGLLGTTRAEIISGVLGVDPAHAMSVSGAGEVDRQTSDSVRSLAMLAPILADVTFQFRILGVNIREFFAILAAQIADPARALAEALTDFMVSLKNSGLARIFTQNIAGLLWLSNLLIRVVNTAVDALNLLAAALADAVINIQSKMANPLAEATWNLTEAAWKKMMSNFNRKPSITTDEVSMSRQMPASSWEKMGLVVNGIGGGTDYAKRTTKATERTAEYLRAIMVLPRGATTGLNPAYPAP